MQLSSNFHQISLGSNFSKLLEKIILSRLNWLAKNHDWFSQDQHGFTTGKSTESASHALVSFVEEGFATNICLAGVFLDKRTFGSAWHPVILGVLIK